MAHEKYALAYETPLVDWHRSNGKLKKLTETSRFEHELRTRSRSNNKEATDNLSNMIEGAHDGNPKNILN